MAATVTTHMDRLPIEISSRIRHNACLAELKDKVLKFEEDNVTCQVLSIKRLFSAVRDQLTQDLFKWHFDFENSTKYNSSRAYAALKFPNSKDAVAQFEQVFYLNHDDLSAFVQRLATFYQRKFCMVYVGDVNNIINDIVNYTDYVCYGFCEDTGNFYEYDDLDAPTISGAERPLFSHAALKEFLN